ncbi:MAG: hypothetical protein J7507_11420 [Pseudoxanthomonas sp.]|nr:hypothetical protein [Pseudoxanthomonas sp.]
MTAGHQLRIASRALLAVLAGLAGMFAANLAGSALATALRLPAGGSPRLGWDLSWIVLSGIAGAWLVVRLAPCAPRRHALAFFLLVLLMDGYAVAKLGADFPPWFSAGLLLTLPLQVWLGTRLALRRRVPRNG